jgi:hypothetical protein
MRNFVTQRELMNLKEEMSHFEEEQGLRSTGRLSSAAIEEIHKMYTEGKSINS